MIIIIDTREQLPYKFKTKSEIGTLHTGDYSIKGAEEIISIERKTIDDIVGCLTGGRGRFEKELYRSRSLEYFALVIECSLSDLSKGRYTSKMNPKSAVQSIVTFSIRYRMPVFFAENRMCGRLLTESLLIKFAREMENRAGAMSSPGAGNL